jgi:NAD(P)-dependent dehydrogenase (short-subunit alcohol dehydrogenase family)
VDFTGKTVLITGAAGGLGSCAAKGFAKRGAKLMLVDVDASLLGALAEELSSDGHTVQLSVTDIGDSRDVAHCVQQMVSAFGRIDAVCNNGAISGSLKSIADYDEDEFDRVIRVNLKSVFLFLKFTIPVMMGQGYGSIVNTSSVSAIMAGPKQSAYVASKSGVLGLTASAAGEVASSGVRVNAICPGAMDTEMLRALNRENPNKDAEALTRQQKSVIPTGRWCTVEEVANLMMFLASDLAGNITGQHFVIDGGRTAVSMTISGATAK